MKTLTIVSVCALVLMASAAFAVNLPLYNSSFEIQEDGYVYPSGWLCAGTGAIYTAMLDPNSHDGDRVLVLDMAETTYAYAIGPWGAAVAQPGIKMLANSQYTVSAWMKKATGHASPGGSMFIEIGSAPGTWGDYDRVWLSNLPELTVDEQWVQYSIVLDTAATPGFADKYIGAIALRGANGIADDTAWAVWDDVRIDGPVVPEPSSLLALGTSLVGLAGFAIRRRK